MDDSDLSGLDLAAAREYIFAYAVDLKRIEKAIAAATADLELWKGRVALAENRLAKDEPDMAKLAAAARAKVEEAGIKVDGLEAERAGLAAKVARMKGQLPRIRASERSVDPDRLLAELQMMTGELLQPEDARTERKIDQLQSSSSADAALEALKKKLSGGGDQSGGAGGQTGKP